MKEVMDTADVAALLKVNIKTVRRWLNSGQLEGADIPGVGYRVTPRDISAFLDKHRRHATTTEEEQP